MALDDLQLRTIDPFAFWPTRGSALVNRPDAAEANPENYVFHTAYLDRSPGPFHFQVSLDGLIDAAGDILLRVHELPQRSDAEASCVAVRRIPLAELSDAPVRIDAYAQPECRYAILGDLAPDAAGSAAGLRVAMSSDTNENYLHDRLIDSRARVFAKPPLFDGLYELQLTEPTLAATVCQACTIAQFDETVYHRWVDRMKMGLHRHRKQWEFVYILAALDHYGALRSGARGLGFGVGLEPLPALMASLGCTVTATDLPPEDERVAEWSGTAQHSANLAGISRPDLIDDAALDRMVTFRPVDMTRVPDDLVDYDFTWSACALEHVGSIVAGLDFIERSIACLRPGGVAVHTTELNLLSDDETLDQSGTVLFRRRDFEEIAARLILKGHEVAPLNFEMGGAPLDNHFDVPPYTSNLHLKLQISKYLTTSYGIVVRRRP